jgi:hypothetical protein
MYSLIITAKLNGVDPRAWLADVLARIADHTASRLHELLPWNWRDAREDTVSATPGARASQRRMRSATPPSTLVFEGSLKERPLVSECVEEAGASDPGFLDQVANRRHFVAEAAAADRRHLPG